MAYEEFTFEVLRQQVVRLIVIVSGSIGVVLEQALPLLTPIVLIVPVIVVAAP
jgi:hypothetical protein